VSRRRWLALGSLVAIAAIAVIAWRLVRDEPRARRRAVNTSRLDVPAFRAELAARVRRAKGLAAARPATAAPTAPAGAPRSKAWDQKGKGPLKGVRDLLLEPQCWVGPMSLCEALQPLAEACADGDARSCIAIGQYLSDEPPRILIASLFFHAACRIGDEDGCKRLDALEPGAPGTCDEDPFACQWRAYKSNDPELHEQACSLGAAESCAMLAFDEEDADKRLSYYEAACQLGHTGACDLIVQLVSPTCEGNVCLPIDEEAASRAKVIACEAGYTDHC
jgi:hypothetical protein